MKQYNPYLEGVTDIIHAMYDLKRLQPKEILAIYDVYTKYNVQCMSKEDLYHVFERELFKYDGKDIKEVIVTEDYTLEIMDDGQNDDKYRQNVQEYLSCYLRKIIREYEDK